MNFTRTIVNHGVAVLLVLGLCSQAQAQSLKVAPASLNAGQGYVLVRLGKRTANLWNTLLIAPYDAALEDVSGKGRAKGKPRGKPVLIGPKSFLAENGNIRTYLVSIAPGRWVLNASPTTCYCLGSYQFEVEPGVITDLGTILIGPENGTSIWQKLAGLHSSPDIEKRGYIVPDAMLVEAVTPKAILPETISDLPRQAANYQHAARIGNHNGLLLNRALPIGWIPESWRDLMTAAE